MTFSDRLKQDLALRALTRAIALRNLELGVIHLGNRGSQYCTHDYQRRLKQLVFQVAMTGKGNCWDSAVSETFYKTLDAELISRHSW